MELSNSTHRNSLPKLEQPYCKLPPFYCIRARKKPYRDQIRLSSDMHILIKRNLLFPNVTTFFLVVHETK